MASDLLQERNVAEGVVADEVGDLLRHDGSLLHSRAGATHAVHRGAGHHLGATHAVHIEGNIWIYGLYHSLRVNVKPIFAVTYQNLPGVYLSTMT